MRSKETQTRDKASVLIAPCGLNCGLCRAHIRTRNQCHGCRVDEGHKSNACSTCSIKNCRHLACGGHRFCFSCDKFPCAPLKHLDKRYQTKYGVSAIRNLERIREIGAPQFVIDERVAWSCPECRETLCMHRPQCTNCGHVWRTNGEKALAKHNDTIPPITPDKAHGILPKKSSSRQTKIPTNRRGNASHSRQ